MLTTVENTHPWSYPKSRNPVVATAEMASERGLPVRPINFGDPIVDCSDG